MTHMNQQRIQHKLSSAHGDITAALAYLADITLRSEPGAARQGLAEIQAQLEQVYALVLMTKRRVRHWGAVYGTESTGADRLDDSQTVFPPDFFDAVFNAEDDDNDADAEECADDADDADDESIDGYDFFFDVDEDPEPDAMPAASELEALWEARDVEARRSAASEQPAISDHDIGLLFGISAEQAGAGVAETGHLNIFGEWVPGRRPGRYKRPEPEAGSDTTADADDPDYNEPGND
jgi:hypothetical protein